MNHGVLWCLGLVVEQKLSMRVAAMANFNLNKTQSLNGALRALFVGEKRGNFPYNMDSKKIAYK